MSLKAKAPLLSDRQNLICHKVMEKQRLYSKLPSTQFLYLVAKGLINYKTVAKVSDSLDSQYRKDLSVKSGL